MSNTIVTTWFLVGFVIGSLGVFAVLKPLLRDYKKWTAELRKQNLDLMCQVADQNYQIRCSSAEIKRLRTITAKWEDDS